MKRSLILIMFILIPGLIAGCGYFQKKDEPPPLPPIEETKPPLTMKSDYFKAYPWNDLSKPRKDGNDPDTTVYTVKEGDTLDKIAENLMGNAGMARDLASYNDLPATDRLAAGDKVIIPNPIMGISSQMLIKSKKETEFAPAKAFDVELKPGDQYKMRFESDINGYAYILREDPKGTEFLYPAPVKVAPKRGKKDRAPEALPRDTGKVEAHQFLDIPMGPKGFAYDPKKKGERIFVFLSLRKIPELEDLKERSLKDKKKIKQVDVEDVMIKVKQGEILSQPPYHLLRISDPKEILGFTLNING
ncbi:MAG: LysM peptidoglycan-binding domain-containing protein [Desulfomonilaceae bacterium]